MSPTPAAPEAVELDRARDALGEDARGPLAAHAGPEDHGDALGWHRGGGVEAEWRCDGPNVQHSRDREEQPQPDGEGGGAQQMLRR
jgi:hypothetical protein